VLWKSPILKKTRNPCWNIEDGLMSVDVEVLAGEMLSFEIWHQDKIDSEFMGRVDVFPYLLYFYKKENDPVVTLRCDSLVNHYLGRAEEKKVLSPRLKWAGQRYNVKGALTLKLSTRKSFLLF